MAKQAARVAYRALHAAADASPALAHAMKGLVSPVTLLHRYFVTNGSLKARAFQHERASAPSWTALRNFSSASGSGQQSGLASKLAQAQDVDQVLQVVESDGRDFDEAAVEEAVIALARCSQSMDKQQVKHRVHESPAFQMLADMLVQGSARHSPQGLAVALGALGRLRFRDQLVLDELSRELMGSVQDLEPEHLKAMVEGLAHVEHSPGILLLDAISERLHQLGGEEQVDEGPAIREGLQDLGHDGRVGDQGLGLGQDKEQPDRTKEGSDYA